MIELKTAILLATSLKMGAMLADASQKHQQQIYEYGKCLGLAFQIKDDWLDIYGDMEKVGKKNGGDIIQNKKTFLFVKAWQLADGKQKEVLAELRNTKNEETKINRTIALYNELSIGSHTKKVMDFYFQKAMQILDAININPSRKTPLITFSDQLYSRSY